MMVDASEELKAEDGTVRVMTGARSERKGRSGAIKCDEAIKHSEAFCDECWYVGEQAPAPYFGSRRALRENRRGDNQVPRCCVSDWSNDRCTHKDATEKVVEEGKGVRR